MFVGEAPGEEEDKKAVPFVGAAGKVLDKMLASIGMLRDDVYICNTVKCRPPQNADPTEEQKNECLSYLTRQIEAIQPKVIVCLGNHASKTVMNLVGLEDKWEPISKIRGKLFDSDPAYNVKVMPLYHPAAMLHNPPLAQDMRKDFKKLKSAAGIVSS
jgi:DNA polymerase